MSNKIKWMHHSNFIDFLALIELRKFRWIAVLDFMVYFALLVWVFSVLENSGEGV